MSSISRSTLTAEQRRDLATRYGISEAVITTLEAALIHTNGQQAQFNHPELGGLGQWMPGMVMIGDMFNGALKAKVDALCTEIVRLLAGQTNVSDTTEVLPVSLVRTMIAPWWPPELGETPTARGQQNTMRYVYFQDSSRLLVQISGVNHLFDTTGHDIRGISQQQSSGTAGDVQHLMVTLANGKTLPLDSLPRVKQG
jgi:hypothetical protein